jgi:P-type Cu+ transporter
MSIPVTCKEGGMAMATDPVCGMRIDTDDAVATAEYEGTIYYFCSQPCHDAFVDDPVSYAT